MCIDGCCRPCSTAPSMPEGRHLVTMLWRVALGLTVLCLYWHLWARSIKQTLPHIFFPAFCVALALLLVGFHRTMRARGSMVHTLVGAALGALASVLAWLFVDGLVGADGWFHGVKRRGVLDLLFGLGLIAVWVGGWLVGGLLAPLVYRPRKLARATPDSQ